VIEVDNPSRWPDTSEIARVEEPVILAVILTNEEYVGGILSWSRKNAASRRVSNMSPARASCCSMSCR